MECTLETVVALHLLFVECLLEMSQHQQTTVTIGM